MNSINWSSVQVWKRLAFATTSLLLATVVAVGGQPLIHENSDAVNLLATTFSILAGFLVAIITILGDPVLLPPGSWRIAELSRQNLERRLARHKWLFFLYLIVLGLLFAGLLFDPGRRLTVWLERAYLFLATIAFMYSLRLPWALAQVQQQRIDSIIEQRRKGTDSSGVDGGSSGVQ